MKAYPKKTNITLKVFFSYLLLGILVIVAAWFIYKESPAFYTKSNSSGESEKLLKISSLLAHMYENENLAKATLYSATKHNFDMYTESVTSIIDEIDTLKRSIDISYQLQQLDSISILLKRKYENIKELRRIKINNETDISFKVGIEELTKMESSLGKITIDHLVEEPEKLESYQREVIDKLVGILNENLEEDPENAPGKKTVDSIVTASKLLLKDLRAEAQNARVSLQAKEKELVENDFVLSEQLRKIITHIESEIFLNSLQKDIAMETAQKRTNHIITLAGILGFLLIILFSFLILSDFWKSQSYRKQLEEAKNYAESVLNSREQLIRMVSHDLKTPLSSIISYTDLLSDSSISNKQQKYVHQLKNSAGYITKLVEDLLAFSKLESGSLYLQKEVFSLRELIEEVIHSVRPVYQKKAVNFELKLPSGMKNTFFKGDPLRIKQITTNLLSNAFKYTHKGNICLEITKKEQEDGKLLINIIVEDTGIGIPKDKLESVFKEFTRVDEEIQKNYEGSGLGLAISKKLAIAMGGDISVRSEKGKGSVFNLQLPLEKARRKKKKTLPPTEKTESSKGLVAIVIDDNNALRRLIKEILQKWNILVFDFEDASLALKELPSFTYDIVFTDIQMPQMDGYSFVSALKKSPHYKQQPVFAISGALSEELPADKSQLFTGHIKKPFSPGDIKNCLETHFEDVNFSYRTEAVKAISLNGESYNLSDLLQFLQNDHALVKEVLGTFLKNTKQDLSRIKKAFKSKDLNAIRETAHKMKPMYVQIKANDVVFYLNQLENTDEISMSGGVIRKLDDLIGKLIRSLRKEIN
ncbi:response regulator [Leptobacterium flavescens]|uniref:histidine kinase n=1 Tax=Leptobacterium flavescens TaxID=472055 RepID=A0A6P0UN12_9FLAO|nr:hybrid sensor histidine kinase/response regulator [Leptobacterium flavescens]NER14565.1 response regulator [Leptobacterium flavescens]